jgi:3-deoxy-D-manno-octulosonic-acid transferase
LKTARTTQTNDHNRSIMKPLHFFYAALSMALTPLAIPGIWCWAKQDPKKRIMLAERLGYDPMGHARSFQGSPKIWVHAVSVGEVKAAESVIEAFAAIHPAAAFLITTTTPTGQEEAIRRLGGRATVCFAPLDLWMAVGRFLTAYRPHALACMETEIWPNWILKAHRIGIKIVFINGRLSSRSIAAYLKIRPLLKSVLKHVDAFSMISAADAHRMVTLGAPAGRVCVNGNAKTDMPGQEQNDDLVERLKRLYAVDAHTPVFIAGSIRGGEVKMMLDVYRRLADLVPGLIFIIAPRHIQKASMIEQLARKSGINCQRRSEMRKPGPCRTAPLVILDTIGELRDLYSIASVVFGGASLVPLGGQNVLEAAIWAKPILFGPHMDDFAEARSVLERFGGGIGVKNTDDLTKKAAYLLSRPGEARRIGALAREAIQANQGAAARHAQVVSRMLAC